jgi:hypothetical protein
MVGPLILIYGASWISRSPFNTKVEVPLEQPVPFSHQHHAVELGIDCRYCHATVETAASAGFPPTQTCMSCHSQIWTNSPLLEPVRESYRTGQPIVWNKVNKLPDFVYFNHSIHINRGINCNYCHGAIQTQMITAKGKPFFMSWCLECHRNPEKFVRPREEVFALYRRFQRKDQLNPHELSLATGGSYVPAEDQGTVGPQLLREYHIKKEQMADCWICHR